MTRPAMSSEGLISPASSPIFSPLSFGAFRRLNAPAKLGPIGHAVREITLNAAKSGDLYDAAGATVRAGTEYAKSLLDQSAQTAAGSPEGKDKTKGTCQKAGVAGLSANELRSIIESEKGLKNPSERRKFLKDVYAQLSGKLPETKELAQQLSTWKNDPGYNQLLGYKITQQNGQSCIETGPTRMHLINERLRVIEQLRVQLKDQLAQQPEADQNADPLQDAHSGLIVEESQLKAEAQLINAVLADLEKSSNTAGFAGFLKAMCGQSGVKWSQEARTVLVNAVTQDVSRFLADRRSFELTEKLLSITKLPVITPGESGNPGIGAELTEFHNKQLAGQTLPQLKRMQLGVKPTPELKLKLDYLSEVIAQLESDTCVQLGKDLKRDRYLGPASIDDPHADQIYTQVARFFVGHLADYQRVKQQFGPT